MRYYRFSMESVVKTNVFLKDIRELERYREDKELAYPHVPKEHAKLSALMPWTSFMPSHAN